jgi:HAD superfamily hydrolase (TIGR01509 family)
MNTIRAVIFDTDGTLVASNDYHAAAWIEVLHAAGHADISFERVRALIGMGGDKVLPELLGIEKESSEGEELSERRSATFKGTYLPRLRPYPCTRELLAAIRERGLEVAIASSAQTDELEPMLELAGASDLLQAQTSSSDAEQSKPDPDVIEATLEQLGEPADAVLMVGDTPYDIESARRAGVATIAFRCGGWWSDEELGGAVAIYDDPADLLAHLDESPLFA